ncbi:hypothetical protein [Paractinoplanes durhamensis]|uniref:Uncharacterized protein n=1 Tax=Paractinoplanes durhamensis TaxID=113563 RepID=A0ABQ3YYH6_9ACTN|nr:hypothetical protein [Actinoplanes durhamensis]GIE02612.1 hypothetical protein Adu01nite_39620 [Actinoplanes durhamensis]
MPTHALAGHAEPMATVIPLIDLDRPAPPPDAGPYLICPTLLGETSVWRVT